MPYTRSGRACTARHRLATPGKGRARGVFVLIPTAHWTPTWRSSRPTRGPKTSCSTRSEEHTSELQSRLHLVCRLLLEKKKKKTKQPIQRHDSITTIAPVSPALTFFACVLSFPHPLSLFEIYFFFF